MRLAFTLCAFTAFLALSISLADAQPGGGKKDKGPKGGGSTETLDDFIAKLMAFNTARDGKLTKKELTDTRLHALFDRADANKDGVVTRDELESLYKKEALTAGGGGGPGGDKGKGPKGKGPKGGPPQPGIVLPAPIQDVLKLSDDQKKQVADLQKEVDARLEKILTADQRQQLREMRERGPGGFGPPPGDKKAPPPGGQ